MDHPQDPSPERRVTEATQTGMFAMMAMMMICCVGIFVLIALIPLIGWPAGIVVAVVGGAGLMYAHMKLMGHGSHH